MKKYQKNKTSQRHIELRVTSFVTVLIFLLSTENVLGQNEIEFSVTGNVPALTQPTDSTCWATTATMLYSWKHKKSMEISEVMKKAGLKYEAMFLQDKGLPGSLKKEFLEALSLKTEGPQNLSVKGWESLLKKFGPLWVTTNEGDAHSFAIHARVITGIAGDGTPNGTKLTIIDPANGSTSKDSIANFVKKFEDVAKIDLGEGADLRPQVVHF